MHIGRLPLALALALALAIGARTAAAANTSVGAGETLTLTQNLVLVDGDTFDAEGTADAPCTIEGAGFSISAAEGWMGSFTARHCTFHSVGTTANHALELSISGTGEIRIEDSTFDACADVIITTFDGPSVEILRNTVLDNSLVAAPVNSNDNTVPAFTLQGYANTVEKHFQGNHVYRSRVHIEAAQNWIIGGYNPGEGNVMIGIRAGVDARGTNVKIVGNYIHVLPDDLNGWNQVKPLSTLEGPFLVEHNVIRDGNWLVDIASEAEIRYNLLADSHDRPWLILENVDKNEKVHHNVFVRHKMQFPVYGMWVLRPAGTTTAEVYNNTFHGGGACHVETLPALAVQDGAFLASLRSNAFVGFSNTGANAGIVGSMEGIVTPAPERLGYADYNLFSNPRAAKDNYTVAVAGKRERLDPGFALNDAPAGGAVDDQVMDPGFSADRIPVQFPYNDDDIKAGTTTVCQILAFYRTLFEPKSGSPMLGTGDPADGTGNNIGAIGGADDQFGKLCAGGDVGSPDLSEATYTCPKLPPGTGTGGTGPPTSHGFVCVCDVAAAPSPGSLAVAALGAVWLLLRRRARRSRHVI